MAVTHAAAYDGPGDAQRAASSTRHLQAEGYAPDSAGLLAALGAQDLAVRSEAAFLLGMAKDPVARPALRSALLDPDARVRVEAALALARLGDSAEALATLAREVRGEFFADAPLRAARALAILGDPSGWVRVLEALDNPLASNRREALAVAPAFLAYDGQAVDAQPVDVVAALIRGTHDPEPILRRDALGALATIADPRATAALERESRAPNVES
jgi:HEAT repeat protein